jgi:hypothetical protein
MGVASSFGRLRVGRLTNRSTIGFCSRTIFHFEPSERPAQFIRSSDGVVNEMTNATNRTNGAAGADTPTREPATRCLLVRE